MHDDLDLRVIERRHDADPHYRAELRQRLAAILDGTEAVPDDDAFEQIAIDLPAAPPTRLEHRRRRVLGVAAVAAAAAAIAGLVALTSSDDGLAPADDSVPAPEATIPAPTTTETEPPTSGGMWPQSTLEEVRAAQARADAGDPAYTWQFRALVPPAEPFDHVEFEITDRFIREVLGWESYLFNRSASADPESTDAEGWPDVKLTNQAYVRCAPGRTNPLYPPQPGSDEPGESCAPTIDDHTYESVNIDLAQLDRIDRTGIWVVTGWRKAPFVQTDPAPLEAEANEWIAGFLGNRIAGGNAGGYVQVYGYPEVPLLYATTQGAPYERYELERIDGPWWPRGGGRYLVRLFADGDATVVEQVITRVPDGTTWLDVNSTTENGQPVVLSHTSSDGAATVSAPSTWAMYWPSNENGADPPDVWFGLVTQVGPPYYWESKTFVGLVDPLGYDAWCAAKGGTPYLTAPADAAAIAQRLVADPNFETTAPVAARIGGVDALSMDITLAPGGKKCDVGITDISRWIHELQPGLRIRLYLVDLPEGMPVETLAVTVVAPEADFEESVAETAPIIESIEFHPARSGAADEDGVSDQEVPAAHVALSEQLDRCVSDMRSQTCGARLAMTDELDSYSRNRSMAPNTSSGSLARPSNPPNSVPRSPSDSA